MFLREHLTERGALTAAQLADVAHGTRVQVGGVVTHRQRPATAGGITFLNVEDETGMVNVVCSPGLWARDGGVGRNATAVLIRGTLETATTSSTSSPTASNNSTSPWPPPPPATSGEMPADTNAAGCRFRPKPWR